LPYFFIALLLLALGVAGDPDELGICWSDAVGSGAWWSSSVVLGHCRVPSDGPETAQGSVSLGDDLLIRSSTDMGH
jgi:hypothetical protein